MSSSINVISLAFCTQKMKVVFLCVFMTVAATLAAPSPRVRRSSYQMPYISPCAAASSPVSYYAPSPGYGYGYPQYGLPTGNQQNYRTEFGEGNEMLSFSDDDHMHLARYAYPHNVGHVLPQVSSPAIGVFPNANAGGCSLPLLFSCTPHVTYGKIAKAHPQYSYGNMEHTVAVHPYRDAEEQEEEPNHHDEKSTKSEEIFHHNMNQAGAHN